MLNEFLLDWAWMACAWLSKACGTAKGWTIRLKDWFEDCLEDWFEVEWLQLVHVLKTGWFVFCMLISDWVCVIGKSLTFYSQLDFDCSWPCEHKKKCCLQHCSSVWNPIGETWRNLMTKFSLVEKCRSIIYSSGQSSICWKLTFVGFMGRSCAGNISVDDWG
jgi:hypothetical protein